MSGTGSYQKLEVWHRSRTLASKMYIATSGFPKSEMFGLMSQIRRAAVSVPSNIAEGRARRGPKGFVHFLDIARGSLAELETLLLISADIGLIEDVGSLLSECDEIGRMLYGLQSAAKKHGEERPN